MRESYLLRSNATADHLSSFNVGKFGKNVSTLSSWLRQNHMRRLFSFTFHSHLWKLWSEHSSSFASWASAIGLCWKVGKSINQKSQRKQKRESTSNVNLDFFLQIEQDDGLALIFTDHLVAQFSNWNRSEEDKNNDGRWRNVFPKRFIIHANFFVF